jgi:bacillithiol synthase
MNFTAQRVSYQQTGYFSRIITDYLNGNDFLRHFFKHMASFEGAESSIKMREEFPTDRKLLVTTLKQQYEDLPACELVSKNLERLADQNTFTITTAHQPAIFTGNLYFIYKILHVIRIAKTLEKKHPDRNFVPVFYMGSEDADLDELGHIYLDKEKLLWETDQSGAVGRMHLSGLEKIIQRIEGEFAGYPYGQELVKLLRDCYLNSDNIQKATQKIIHELFGSFGLVVLIPDDRLLKSVMRGIFKDDLLKHLPFQITQKNLQELSTRYPVQANPREINLFYLKDDIRERLDSKNGKFEVHNTNIRFSLEEIERELAEYPERFSPNVILRGLFQETILPNIVFVGGGGETAYWLELKPLFEHYCVPFPVLVLRNSFLLIKKNWKQKIEKAGLQPIDLFKSEEKLVEEYVRQFSPHELSLQTQMDEIRGFYGSLKKISAAVDKTLEQHVDKLETQSIQKLEELEKKILRAEKKNHEEVRRKIYEIKEALFPLNNLQERIDNFIPWYAEYGRSFIDLLYNNSLSFEQEFIILEE